MLSPDLCIGTGPGVSALVGEASFEGTIGTEPEVFAPVGEATDIALTASMMPAFPGTDFTVGGVCACCA